MGFQADIADALLETIKGCVNDCAEYDRILWQLGDITIECSTLGISLLTFPAAAEVADCAVHDLRLQILVAKCCYPVAGPDGGPPPEDAIMKIARCVTDDVEKIMCCIRSIAFEVPGLVKPCRPKILAPAYSRPQGGCVAARINMSITGVPQA